jgi:hypothetical protein
MFISDTLWDGLVLFWDLIAFALLCVFVIIGSSNMAAAAQV